MELRTIVCEICGQERNTSCSWAKYCGDRCKMIAWASKQKAMKKVERKDEQCS